MMTRRLLRLTSAAVMIGALGTANAASILLVVTEDTGRSVTMDITADFTGVTTIGGGFDVAFSGLAFVSFDSSYPGDPGFSREPDVLDGLLFGFAFGDFNGLTGDFGAIGTLTFDVTDVDWVASTEAGIGDPFLDVKTFQPIPIEYNTVSGSAVIPVPAAAWLMFGGLGALFGVGRVGAASAAIIH